GAHHGRQYRQHVNLHIAPRLGRLKLAHLTPAKVETFRDDLLANLSRPMARKVLTSLKSLLKGAKHAHVAADGSVGSSKRAERKRWGSTSRPRRRSGDYCTLRPGSDLGR